MNVCLMLVRKGLIGDMSSGPVSDISPFHHYRSKVFSDIAILMRSALKVGRTDVPGAPIRGRADKGTEGIKRRDIQAVAYCSPVHSLTA